MPLIDISQPLRATLPVWPGDTRFAADCVWDHDAGPVRVSRYTLSTHAGSHADAPLHYAADGAAIDAVDLDAYVGPARVIDARGWGAVIEPGRLAPHLADTPPRVLLRTFDRFPHECWPEAFTTVAPAAIALLAERGVRLIGVDAPSLDPLTSQTMDAHRAVLAADLRILEGLVLDRVEPGEYELIALPLALAGLDAAPVRAVLRPLAP